ncbi:AraC family transcriptional regulator [Burkholderia arboris]|uniref:AraC family transcriptional regulator n=1 Tax=Burkholderia arboris TaxID=488730 RepID=UPI0018C4C325|nr:AraC family transcriptional regulator [Burkholderia arboris]MCA8493963.1 AraC family transcriptional regulator [Burkholderia arboris]
MHSPDVFSEIYARARVRGRVSVLTCPGVAAPSVFEGSDVFIHAVQQGTCRLVVNGSGEVVVLASGDVVALMKGQPHRIDAQPHAAAPGDPRPAGVRIVTIAFTFDGVGGDILARGLPDVMTVRGCEQAEAGSGPSTQWIPTTIGAIDLELQAPSVGSEVMLSKTAELMFIWLIRRHMASGDPARRGWAAALGDPAVNRALSLLHADPGYEWSVPELARRVGQSRSAFSQKFVDVMGETPMRYLVNWRMDLAAHLLASSTLRISKIAEQAGYASQAAFGRVFRRRYGMSPSDYRDTYATESGHAGP